jgi:hypothetical protein
MQTASRPGLPDETGSKKNIPLIIRDGFEGILSFESQNAVAGVIK